MSKLSEWHHKVLAAADAVHTARIREERAHDEVAKAERDMAAATRERKDLEERLDGLLGARG